MKITLDVEIERRVEVDEDPDLSYLEQDCFNEATDTEPEGYGARRIAAYHAGEWEMVGIVAVAVDASGHEVARSGGLWGVESDSGEDYFAEIFEQEKLELRHQLGVQS